MSITHFQMLLLDDMRETAPWEHECCNGAEKRSLSIMQEKGLVQSVNYANGLHWELTDKGLDAVAVGGLG